MLICILYYFPGSISLSEGKMLLGEWSILLFLGLVFFRNKWLKAWFLWMVACLLLQYNKYSYMQFNMIFFYLIFYQTIESKATEKNISGIYNAIAIIVLVHVIWTWMQFFDIWIVYHLIEGFQGHIVGVMPEKNSCGALIAVGIPVFLRRRWCFLLPVVLGALVLPNSVAATLSVGVGLGIYILLKPIRIGRFTLLERFWARLVVVTMGVIGILIYLVRFNSIDVLAKGSGRFETWKYIWKVARTKPFQGFGIGQYRNVFYALDTTYFRKGTNIAWWRAHNEYLELMFNQGFIGLGLALGFIGSNIERFLKNRTELGFIAFIGVVISLVSCVGHFLAHTTVFIISLIYFAIMCQQGGKNEKSRHIPNPVSNWFRRIWRPGRGL